MRILLFDSGIGLLPFYSYLLKNKIYNNYYLEMEEDYFPLGQRTHDWLLQYVQHKLAKWSEEKYDEIYIICNTFSVLLKEIDTNKYSFIIHTILECNEKIIDEETILIGTKVTCEYFQKKGYMTLDFSHLVPLIENNDITQLIIELKKYPLAKKKIILGCTHFTHILFLLKIINPHCQFIDAYPLLTTFITNNERLTLQVNNKAQFYFEKYFFSHIL